MSVCNLVLSGKTEIIRMEIDLNEFNVSAK